MRWLAIIIWAYLLLGLEQGLNAVLVGPGWYHAAPGLLLILGVYIGLTSPSMVVLWSWLILGLLYDLAHPVLMSDARMVSDAVIIGPGALGFLMGAVVMLRMRGLVYRGSLLSMALFTFVSGLFVHLTIVFIFSVRGLSLMHLPGEHLMGQGWAGELVSRFISLAYSTILAVPVGWVLLRAGGLFHFEANKSYGVRS